MPLSKKIKNIITIIISLSLFILFQTETGFSQESDSAGYYTKVDLRTQAVTTNQGGSASFSYSIEVPPGRNDLQPNISLQYSSYNGNGWVGVGWDLNMGSISRSTKHGLNYSANVFMADGADLVSRSSDWGANYFGAKIEGAFTKYYLDTSSNSWLATAKDGTKYYYGSSPASRMTNTHGTYSWHLDKVEDTNGNYIKIEYTINQSQIYLYRIYYTYHTTHFNGPNDYSYMVEFGLEDREDNIYSYKTHSLVTTAKRLKTITVSKANETTASYKYVLNYDNSGPNGISRLSQIKQLDPDNENNFLPPYDFTYYNGADGTFGDPTTISVPKYEEDENWRSNKIVFGDINGDGIQDFIKAYAPEIENLSGADVTVYIYLADSAGGFTYEGLMTLEKCPTVGVGPWYGPPDYWINHMSVSLGDVNGDGWADIMSNGMNGQVHVYLSYGDGTFSSKKTTSGANNCEDNVFLADLNGDGKSDLVKFESGGHIYTALSNGTCSNNNCFGSQVTDHVGGSGSSWSTSVQMADFNGDGKADVLSCDSFSTQDQQLNVYHGFNLRVFYGDGAGGFDEMYPEVFSISVPDYAELDFLNLRTLDANGDGLADIAYVDYTHQLKVHLSTGTGMTPWTYEGFDINVSYVHDFADIDGDGLDDLISDNGRYFYKSNGDGTFAEPVIFDDRLNVDADIDGDGRKDKGKYSPVFSNLSYSYANGEDAADYIESITNTHGGKTQIIYDNSSGLTNNKIPYIIHPVKTIETYDGIIEEGDTEDIPDVTGYDYANGYYNYDEKDLRGFGYVKKTNPDNTAIETTYELYDNYKKGRPLTEVIKDAGQGTPLMATTNTWGTHPEYPSTWAFVKLDQKKTVYENNTNYYTQEDYTYDNTNGFTEFEVNTGTDANGQAVAQVTQYTGYGLYGTNAWRVNKEIVAESYNKVSDTATNLARKMTYEYNSSGNMTQKKFWRTSGTAYNSIDYGHDDFGNVTSETDALEHPPTTIVYDTTYTFPVTITNPKGHVTTKTWDDIFGKEDTVTDPNGTYTKYEYDPFGRPDTVTNYDSPSQNYIAGHTDTDYYDSVFPSYTRIKTLESGSISTGSYIAKEEYYDGLGRTIKVVTDGIDDQEPPAIKQIYSTTHYDNMGRKSEVYGPFFNGEAEDSRYYEKTLYDKMGRVDSIESPSSQPGDPSIIDYAYPNFFTTVITDPDNKQKTEKRDHLGRIFEVIEHADAGNQSTTYAYNAAGDMTEVWNALYNTDQSDVFTSITYDARGLKTYMNDPDMGIWYYTYDENGNLKTQTDAKSQVITFNYEELNRVSEKIYTPSSQNNPTVNYAYDNAINGKGQLYSVANTKVTTIYDEYDEMGRVKSVSKTITGDIERTTETEYDLSGKVKKITYDVVNDGFEVSNTYYPGTGLLDTVTGKPSGGSAVEYAKCTEYEPTGKIGRITHTYNDTETVYTYDLKTTRLTNLLTSGPAPGNITIQNKSYNYSKTGDIENIIDNLKEVTYNYEYDNLHRLLEETTTDNSPPTSTEILIYTYNDNNKPNAVRNINYNGNNYPFDYDLNGNMTEGWDFTGSNIVERDITWNADNMPVSVTRNGVITSLTYDGDGVRVKKVAGGTTTYYVSNDYEIKNGVATKYVFAGNLRVASIEGENDTKIYHKDHLGSSVAITDNNAGDLETSEYLPFGGMREHTGTDISDYKFTDQELDNESNLYNYDARLYDPVIGRFVSPDPEKPNFYNLEYNSVYNPQTHNRYTYCTNSPLNYTDPSGLSIKGIIIKWTNKASKHVYDRHIAKYINKSASKFKNTNPTTIGKRADETLLKADRVTLQGNKTLYEKDFGKTIGTDGETIQRVVVKNSNKKGITTFPSHTFKETILGVAVIVGQILDPFDSISGELAGPEYTESQDNTDNIDRNSDENVTNEGNVTNEEYDQNIKHFGPDDPSEFMEWLFGR